LLPRAVAVCMVISPSVWKIVCRMALTYIAIRYIMQASQKRSHIPGSLWVVVALEPQLSRRKGVHLIFLMKLMVRTYF